MKNSSSRQRPLVPAALTAILLSTATACTGGRAEEPFESVADMQELMLHVVEPAAQEYWGAVGWIIDADGEEYIRPTTDEEWLHVENAAFMVAESGNLMMMGDRALDDAGWNAMARAMTEVGRRALAVAEAKDEQGVFDAGAEMYAACSACHAAYSPEILRPNDDRAVRETEEPGEGDGGA